MNSDTTEPIIPPRFWPLALTAIALTALADFLFWRLRPGGSVGIFAAVLGACVLAMRKERGPRAWLAFALLLGACAQTAIKLCLTNVCVIVALLIVLAGGTFFLGLPRGWPRWLSQTMAVLAFAGRIPWLVGLWLAQRTAERKMPIHLGRMVAVLAPAFVLGLIFIIIFSSGNALFGDYIGDAVRDFTRWILTWDFSIGRLFFWLVFASVALAFLRPQTSLPAPCAIPPAWTRPDASLARMQTLALLLVVNGIFLAVNTVDAVHLWLAGPNPALRLYDEIHSGVNALITATVIAAIVLSALFQQQADVSRGKIIRLLGLAWIAQNLVLAASVYYRLELYVTAYHLLTDTRIYVGCFLALVIAGYVFLTLHILRGPALGRLLARNAAATFALFYALQFLDVRGFAANWCAHRYLTRAEWSFDANYWAKQGPAAWPALRTAAGGDPARPFTTSALANIESIAAEEKMKPTPDWRTRQLRFEKNRAALGN